MWDDWIIHAGQIAGALTALATCITLAIKYAVVRPIKSYIDQATYPIQPTANGGLSLPDIAKAVHELRQELRQHLERCG